MAVVNGQPSAARLPFWIASALDHAVSPHLGFVKAEVAGDADWLLPSLDYIVAGALLCVLNPTAFSVTLHAAAGDSIEVHGVDVPSLLVAPGAGVELVVQPAGWLKRASLGTAATVTSAPPPGEPLLLSSAGAAVVQRLEAGPNIGLLDAPASVTVRNLLEGLTADVVTRIGLESPPPAGSSLGYRSALSATLGGDNSSLGVYSLYWNTSGSFNTAVGARSMGWHPIATQSPGPFASNSALGSNVMMLMASGDGNVAVGSTALRGALPPTVNAASSNVALGVESLSASLSASQNAAVGRDSLKNAGTAAGNAAGGFKALFCNETYLLTNVVTNNTAHGYMSLIPRVSAAFAASLVENCAYGALSMESAEPSLIGNVGLGYRSLNACRSNNNTASGWEALKMLTTGSGCSALGYRALGSTGVVTNCTGLGQETLRAVTNGARNTAVGFQAGIVSTSGNSNTSLGAGAGPSGAVFTRCLALGAGATPSSTGRLALGSPTYALSTTTTVGAAGPASPLPATPALYLQFLLNGTLRRLPLYL